MTAYFELIVVSKVGEMDALSPLQDMLLQACLSDNPIGPKVELIVNKWCFLPTTRIRSQEKTRIGKKKYTCLFVFHFPKNHLGSLQ